MKFGGFLVGTQGVVRSLGLICGALLTTFGFSIRVRCGVRSVHQAGDSAVPILRAGRVSKLG